MKKSFILTVLYLIPFFAISQTKIIDSLKLEFSQASNDTIRVRLLINLTEELSAFNPDTVIVLCNKAISIIDKNIHKSNLLDKKIYLKAKAEALNNLGLIYKKQGESFKALDYYLKSLKIKEEIGDRKGIATSYNNLGSIYKSQGDIPRALEYNLKSLKIKEEIGDRKGIATSLNNIGSIYDSQNDFTKALEYYLKSLKIKKEIADKKGIAISLNNVGSVYDTKGNPLKALEYYQQSLKIEEEIGNKQGVATSLANIGSIYKKQGEIDKALDCHLKSLKIREEMGNKRGIAYALNNIGDLYKRKGYSKKALEYGRKSLEISKELGYPENLKRAANLLKAIYNKEGRYKEALDMYELYITMRDSINNEDTRIGSMKQQFQYEYSKKAAADSVRVAEEKIVVALQFKQEQTQRYALYGGLILVMIFSGFMFNRFRITKKQKNIIVLQKYIVDEKQKEITDSINYAKRIQFAILPSIDDIKQFFPQSFILYKPKDIVSGDFYWASKLNNGNFALVTADSTGHGVPGAIMSLLNITSLEKAIETLNNPSDILNSTRKTIIARLKKDGSEHGGKDGMDASLTVYDFKNKKLIIAAANNPVWIVRGAETIEVKADKMPIGKHDREDVAFTQTEIQIQSGDVIYTLTDGFADQFGGGKGKKFLSKNLRELLSVNAHLPMNEQKELLEKTFSNWIGNMEQVDDVTVIGVRV